MTLNHNNQSAEPFLPNGSAVSTFNQNNDLNNSIEQSLSSNNLNQFVDNIQLATNSAVQLTMPSFGNILYSSDNAAHCPLNSAPTTMSPIGLDRQWNSNDALGNHERLINNHSNSSTFLTQPTITNNVHHNNILPNLGLLKNFWSFFIDVGLFDKLCR